MSSIIDNVTAPITGDIGSATPFSLALTWLVIGVIVDRTLLKQ